MQNNGAEISINTFTLTVESINNPHSDYYEVKLSPCPNITWQPGEFGVFSLPGKIISGNDCRTFSIASVMSEGCVMLGTRVGKEPSEFKKTMLSMKKGESVSIRGPFGDFKIQDETSPVVLFASGVGVTPIRALLKQLEHNENRNVEVVYASTEFYLYCDEITEIANNNPKINLYKTTTREETTQKITELAKHYGDSAFYYISGAPIVITSTRELLGELNVSDKKIISDSFMGYDE